jgi:hypothetical protein
MAGKPKLTSEERALNRKNTIKAWRDKNPLYNQQYYLSNKERTKSALQKNYRNVKEKNPWVLMLRATKTRAKKRGMTFDLDAEYLRSIWTDVCPVFNIKMASAKFESGSTRSHKSKPQFNSPTLDRIDSSRGYEKGNVCIISYRANVIKNCGTADEHRLIAEFMDKFN